MEVFIGLAVISCIVVVLVFVDQIFDFVVTALIILGAAFMISVTANVIGAKVLEWFK